MSRITLFLLTALTCLGLLSACGGTSMSSSMATAGSMGSGSDSAPAACSAATCGPAFLTMTDAKGDFLSYIVTLTSLQLQSANGTSL